MSRRQTNSSHSYLSSVVWLRWKLWRRRWQRQGPLLRAVGVIGTILAIPLCILSFLIALGLGVVILPSLSRSVIVIAWGISSLFFIYVRIMGLWINLQQDEGLPLERLLHLPIPFQTVFSLNFVLSQLSFSNILFLPAFLGFAIACTLVLDPGNVVLIPTSIVIVLCVGALLHQLHSWLVQSMVTKRKRMAFAYLIFFGVVILAQVPNLYLVYEQKQGDSRREQPQLEQIAAEIVSDNLNDQIQDLNEASTESIEHWSEAWILTGSSEESSFPWKTVLLTIGLLLLAILSFKRSYRSTLARYRDGRELRVGRTRQIAVNRERSSRSMIARSPILAVTTVTIKGWTRSAYGKMGLMSPLFLVLLIPLLWLHYPVAFEPSMLPLVLMGAMAFIGAPAGLACNLFAFDRLGFRLFLFAGFDLKNVLLGKFFALFALFFLLGCFTLVLAGVLSPIPIQHLLATGFQSGMIFVGCVVLGIVWSSRYPYAVSFTSMKAHGGSATVLALFAELCFAALMIWVASRVLAMDIALEATGRGFPLYFIVSVLEFLMFLAAAGLLLKPLAKLVAARSNHILDAVAVEN